MLKFRNWLFNEDDMRGCKLGLYPSLTDSLGQYPPLYMTPISADFIYYYDRQYGKKPLKSLKPGVMDPDDMEREPQYLLPKYKLPPE